jgi:hypothetical protein
MILRMRPSILLTCSIAFDVAARIAVAQQPVVGMVDTPTVNVLTGLTVPQFEAEMQSMTSSLNQQFFPDYVPAAGESRPGKVTCFTCHQGNDRPKTAP